MGDEDVLGLEVAVNNLLAVHVVKGIADFADDLFCERSGDVPCGDKFFEGASVHPFHHDAIAYDRVAYLAEVLADSAVVEGEAYVEVFCQQVFIHQIAAKFFLEGLVDEESSVFADAVQFIEPVL